MATRSKDQLDPTIVRAVKAALEAQSPSDQEAIVSVHAYQRPASTVPQWVLGIFIALLAFFASQTFDVFKGKDGEVSEKIDRILVEIGSIQKTLASQERGQQDTDRRVQDIERDVDELRSRVDTVTRTRGSQGSADGGAAR